MKLNSYVLVVGTVGQGVVGKLLCDPNRYTISCVTGIIVVKQVTPLCLEEWVVGSKEDRYGHPPTNECVGETLIPSENRNPTEGPDPSVESSTLSNRPDVSLSLLRPEESGH